NSTTITLTSLIPPNSTFIGNTSEPTYNTPQHHLPPSCRVVFAVPTAGRLNTSAGAELWLPTNWSGRYLAVGNGGFAGAINYPDLAWGVRKGFAAMSTDTGHSSSESDGSWLGDPAKAIDWGHRALHLTTVAAKALVASYYSSGITHSYYAGCSTGGRQGLSAAQRYPRDYEGVLVGSAIPWQTHTSAWQTWVALGQFSGEREGLIPEGMWAVIAEAVLRACDAVDGVVDGVVMDPRGCGFRAEALLCGRDGTGCLSAAQVANLERMYGPWVDADGVVVNPGLAYSGEASFGGLMNQAQPDFVQFYEYAVVNDSSWDWTSMSAATVALADSINPGGSNAYDPDLRAFQRARGKVLQYHGFSDPLVPTYNAPAWYDRLVGFYADVGREGEVPDFYRLFTVPGMGHCSGGSGAWVLDGASQGGVVPGVEGEREYSMLWSLVEWVEGGKAPERVVGTKFVNDSVEAGVQFRRPVCRWPTVAEYVGGEAWEAESWKC
ncbi:tannase and feruloyl esterase, partial [Teratosphaeria nubilosa]